MSQPDHNSKVTLEDLLRLKRSERPNPEFWSKFEQELRQKQLTALVKKRRWWHELPLQLNRWVYLPIGATAIVAFTLVTVRYSAPSPITQVMNTAPAIAAADPAVETLATTVIAESGPLRSVSHEEPIALAAVLVPPPVATGDTVASAPVPPVRRELEMSSPPSVCRPTRPA